MVSEKKKYKRIYVDYVKRILDAILALAIIAVFWWLYVIVALFVCIGLGRPVIFKQERPGKNEKIFYLYKFRSMTNDKDGNGNLLPDELRLNRLGKILRRTSLDEIPELFNVIKGDMSFIGPRPLLVRYLPYYTEEERHRHDVKPGITGLAQVNGRNYITWEEIFKYDLKYVNNCSLKMDTLIILKTIYKIISHSDISDSTQGNTDSMGRTVHDALDKERS